MDAIHSKMKIRNARTKRIGIKYGELKKHDVMLSYLGSKDKEQMEEINSQFKISGEFVQN